MVDATLDQQVKFSRRGTGVQVDTQEQRQSAQFRGEMNTAFQALLGLYVDTLETQQRFESAAIEVNAAAKENNFPAQVPQKDPLLERILNDRSTLGPQMLALTATMHQIYPGQITSIESMFGSLNRLTTQVQDEVAYVMDTIVRSIYDSQQIQLPSPFEMPAIYTAMALLDIIGNKKNLVDVSGYSVADLADVNAGGKKRAELGKKLQTKYGIFHTKEVPRMKGFTEIIQDRSFTSNEVVPSQLADRAYELAQEAFLIFVGSKLDIPQADVDKLLDKYGVNAGQTKVAFNAAANLSGLDYLLLRIDPGLDVLLQDVLGYTISGISQIRSDLTSAKNMNDVQRNILGALATNTKVAQDAIGLGVARLADIIDAKRLLPGEQPPFYTVQENSAGVPVVQGTSTAMVLSGEHKDIVSYVEADGKLSPVQGYITINVRNPDNSLATRVVDLAVFNDYTERAKAAAQANLDSSTVQSIVANQQVMGVMSQPNSPQTINQMGNNFRTAGTYTVDNLLDARTRADQLQAEATAVSAIFLALQHAFGGMQSAYVNLTRDFRLSYGADAIVVHVQDSNTAASRPNFWETATQRVTAITSDIAGYQSAFRKEMEMAYGTIRDARDNALATTQQIREDFKNRGVGDNKPVELKYLQAPKR
jgi:hypothetical protein